MPDDGSHPLSLPPLDAATASPFLFVRHGQTDYNLRGLLAGSVDIPLTELGIRQAEAAAEILRAEPVGAIFASPLGRARHTAEIIAAPHGLPVTIIEDFRERDWGEMEGRNFPPDLGMDQPPGGEPMEAYLARVSRALETLQAGVPVRGYALLAAHAGIFDALCRLLHVERSAGIAGNAAPLLFRPPEDPKENRGWTITPLGGSGTG